jgi:hypothetical protein
MQKFYVGHLHHYSKSVPMVWDPKKNWSRHNFMSCLTTTTTPYKHMIQTSHTRTQRTNYSKQTAINMMILLKKNTLFYFLTGGGVDLHPDNLTPNIEKCQESLTMTSTHQEHHSDTQNNFHSKHP